MSLTEGTFPFHFVVFVSEQNGFMSLDVTYSGTIRVALSDLKRCLSSLPDVAKTL